MGKTWFLRPSRSHSKAPAGRDLRTPTEMPSLRGHFQMRFAQGSIIAWTCLKENPIASMEMVYICLYKLIFMVNVGKYTIPWMVGVWEGHGLVTAETYSTYSCLFVKNPSNPIHCDGAKIRYNTQWSGSLRLLKTCVFLLYTFPPIIMVLLKMGGISNKGYVSNKPPFSPEPWWWEENVSLLADCFTPWKLNSSPLNTSHPKRKQSSYSKFQGLC